MFDFTGIVLACLIAGSCPPDPSPGVVPVGPAATFTVPGRGWSRWPYRATRFWLLTTPGGGIPGVGLCDDPDCAACRIEVYPG